jgi:hypothetical protein
MGLVRRSFLVGAAFAVLSAAALPAFAIEATLVADAHVSSARPAVNSGGISNLNVGGGYTALLQFDLSTLPAGTTSAQVSRATLRLYCNRMDTAGLVSVQPVAGTWGEYSVTYATLPSLGAAAQVISVGQAGAYVAVDVTALVQGWVSAPATNNGLALTAGTAVLWCSSIARRMISRGMRRCWMSRWFRRGRAELLGLRGRLDRRGLQDRREIRVRRGLPGLRDRRGLRERRG